LRELLAPELGEEENQEGVDFQTAEEHAGGEDPFGSGRKMGEVVQGAHLAEAGAGVPQSRGYGGHGGEDVRAQEGDGQGSRLSSPGKAAGPD